MRSRVRVTLICREEVVIEVEHEPDEDPADLTREDERSARDAAGVNSIWDVEFAEVVS